MAMHEPVLVEEILTNLQVGGDGVYLDATVGLGGHVAAMLKTGDKVRVVGMDRDHQALEMAKKRLSLELNKRFFAFEGNFKDILDLKVQFPLKTFDGILLDLGVSSYQLDTAERGFSFQKEGPLDMRMSHRQRTKASDLVNGLSEEELTKLFFEYGEERFSKKISRVICRERAIKPIETTLELANLIAEISPRSGKGIHPATRVFQALRIAVNDELNCLDEALEDMVHCLKEKGRLAVIDFHSLEDRIVKHTFVKLEKPCTCPHDFPKCVCGKVSLGKRVTRKPILPTKEEVQKNSRSRSAKLRVFERMST